MENPFDNNPIVDFIKKRKKITLLIVLIGLTANILTVFIPISIGKYYQLVFHMQSRRVRFLKFIPDEWWNTVPKFIVFFFVLIFLRFMFFFWFEFLLRKEAAIFIKEIKDYLFQHQLQLAYPTYQQQGTGKYLLRYSGDINSLKNLYIKGTIRLVIDTLMIITAFYWLYKLHHAGAIAVIILFIFSWFLLRIIIRKVEFYSLQKRDKTSAQLSFVSRTLNSILNVIALNKQKVELKKYTKRSEAVKQADINYNQWFVLNKAFISFFQYFILGIVLFLFYRIRDYGEIHQSHLISFILLYLTILPVIRRLFMIETVYKLGNISLKKLKHILNLPKEPIHNGLKMKANQPKIYFNRVVFYNSTPINFKVVNQNLNTLMLPSNVSPMDIILALLRIKEDYKGQIMLEGKDIRQYSPHSVRRHIAVASTGLPFTGRTVYEAVTRSRSKKTKPVLEKKYNLLKKKFEMNLNLDDPIGENGLKMNHQQREFLAFARGILQNKPILLVDDFPYLKAHFPEAFNKSLKETKSTVIQLLPYQENK